MSYPEPTSRLPARIVFLDWLRVFAFVSVLVGHKYINSYLAVAYDPQTQAMLRFAMRLLAPLFDLGGAGVAVFFLVSGYIITQVLQREDVHVFLIRRIFRIYPLYAAAVLIEALLKYVQGQPNVDFIVLLQQLSLFGDLFQTPYTLTGVEWTLRVEILFYLFMAALKFTGVIDGAYSRAMPWILAATAFCLLFLLGAAPGKWAWCTGYLNLFGPFLLLGSFFALYEEKRVRALACAGMSLLVLLGYAVQVSKLQPILNESYFPAYAFAMFLGFWLARDKLTIGAFGLVLSELTYAVYLFHNWMYEHFVALASRIAAQPVLIHSLALVALLTFCWIMVRIVERPGIRFGRRLSHRARPAPAAS